MYGRLLSLLLPVLVVGAVTSCIFDDTDEDCGSTPALTAAAVSSCVDRSNSTGVGPMRHGDDVIRLDSYDIRLPSGESARSTAADFEHRPPRLTLAVTREDGQQEQVELSVGETLTSGDRALRLVRFCDTAVGYLKVLPPG